MMNFIYDSRDTVKKLKHPSKKEFINLTVAIFVLVIIAGFFFITTDSVFSEIHKRFHALMTN